MKALLNLLGDRLLRYLLAVPASDALQEDRFSERQRSVLATLEEIVPKMLRGVMDSSANHLALGSLFYYNELFGNHSLANALRLQAGGDLPPPGAATDRVEQSLRRIAVECYPSFLARPPRDQPPTFWQASPTAAIQHPENERFVKALLEDEQLAGLFPGFSAADVKGSFGGTEITACWTLNTGRGGTEQAIGLAGQIISNAYFRVVARGEDPEPTACLDTIAEVLNDVRRLANGEAVPVPRLVGFSDIELAEGLRVSLSQGILRPTTALERETLLPDGGNIKVVLETTCKVRLEKVQPWRVGQDIEDRWPDNYDEIVQETRRSMQRVGDQARLALLLSGEPDQLIGPVEIAGLVLDPLTMGGQVWWGHQRGSPVGVVTITAEIARRAEHWSKMLRKHTGHNLDISMRRLLSAVASRIDPTDGFIDAVICWENMFGTKAETLFRVTGAMSWLLEPESFERRMTLQGELKKLYDIRSRVVHGSKELDTQKAVEYRNRSVLLAAECLRRLYERPDLLPLSSESRSAGLLLGQPNDGALSDTAEQEE